jgi:hypothetical protein
VSGTWWNDEETGKRDLVSRNANNHDWLTLHGRCQMDSGVVPAVTGGETALAWEVSSISLVIPRMTQEQFPAWLS